MIYVILQKQESELQKLIINFVKENIKYKNFDYTIIWCNKQHIIESQLEIINSEKDIVLWNPFVAGNNLELVKSFNNSIVILEKTSLYMQKLSSENPINENLAINHGFYIIYIYPEKREISNDDWKLVVQNEMFLLTLEQLQELIIKGDESNIKKEKVIIPDIFEDIVEDISKNQINFN